MDRSTVAGMIDDIKTDESFDKGMEISKAIHSLLEQHLSKDREFPHLVIS